MHYLLYQITNLIDGKIYVGVHKTKNPDDSYMGSGKLLKRAITKHGIENFKKEILYVFDNPEDMFKKEIEIVTADFVLREDTYNLKQGGNGGWDHIDLENRDSSRLGKLCSILLQERLATDPEFQRMYSANLSAGLKKAHRRGAYKINGMLGKTHSDETKLKMSRPRGKYNVDKTGVKRGPYKKRDKN